MIQAFRIIIGIEAVGEVLWMNTNQDNSGQM